MSIITAKRRTDTYEDVVITMPDLIEPLANPVLSRSEANASSGLPMPRFDDFTSIHVQTTKIAARMNAAQVSKAELNKLLGERQELLDKKFSDTITRQEINRLEYVRWSLDRIEDALHGHDLDALEESVIRYERFQAQLEIFESQLHRASTKRRS